MFTDMPLQSHRQGIKVVEEFNVILAGVGGQGIILSSDVLGTAATIAGLNSRGSEVIGMSQRGGSVTSHVRMGSSVYGPLIPEGKGDVLVGFEPTEALRNITLLSRTGLIIVNTRPIIPHTVSLGLSPYPNIDEVIGKSIQYARTIAFNATDLAKKAGSVVTVNMVMLGSLCGSEKLPIERKIMLKAIELRVPSATIRVNSAAFRLGYEKVREINRN